MNPFFAADPQVQAEIALLVPLLKALSVNEVLTYATASRTIGRDVTKKAYYSMLTARKEVEKADGVRFAVVRRIGIKRLAAEDIPSLGTSLIRRIHRTSRVTTTKLSDLRSYNDMAFEDRLKIAGQRMVASDVTERTSRRAVKEVEDNIRQAGPAINFGTVLKKKDSKD